MIKYVAIFGFWIAVIINLLLWRNSRDHTTFWAVLFLATGLTLQLEQIYTWLDPLLGGRNWLAVLSDIIVLAGIFAIIDGVTRTFSDKSAFPVWLLIVGIAVAIALVVIFATMTPHPTTTNITATYRDQIATHIYNLVLFLAIALAFLFAGVVCAMKFATLASIPSRIGVAFIILGCVTGLAMCVAQYSMTFGYLFNAPAFMNVGRAVYGTSRSITVLLVTIGMVLPPAAAWVAGKNEIQRSVESLKPIHNRCEDELPRTRDNRKILTQMLVDIHSGILRHGEEAILAGESPDILTRAEQALTAEPKRSAYPKKSDGSEGA